MKFKLKCAKALLFGFMAGVGMGVDIWYVRIFNKKIPKVLCCIIAILTIPINILGLLITLIVCLRMKKSFIATLVEDMEIKEELEELYDEVIEYL